MIFDYTLLDEPGVRLSLVRTPTGWNSVIDQHGALYLPPTRNIETCLRFMSAMASKKHASIDDASVERATWTAAQEQHSVRVADNVVPIRMHAQLDEPKVCKDCGDAYINFGSHMERCYGRPRGETIA